MCWRRTWARWRRYSWEYIDLEVGTMRAAYFGVFLALAAGALHAQTMAKAVHVTVSVKDQIGTAIPKANVNFADAAGDDVLRTKVIRTTTNRDGVAELDLLPGKYGLDVLSPGFRSLHKPLEVNGLSNQQVPVVLEVSMYSGPVQVEVETPRLQLEPITLTETVSRLPLPQFTLPSRSWGKQRGHHRFHI